MLTLVLYTIVLYVSLLLLICSISTRNIGSVIVVPLFVRLMILLALCPFSCTSVLMYSIFSFGCNPFVTNLNFPFLVGMYNILHSSLLAFVS